MIDTNYELELYRLCANNEGSDSCYVAEMGWISDDEFCIWVPYMWVDDFMQEFKGIFGYEAFDDGGFDANMQSDGICIDLCKAVGGYMDIEKVFSKEKYQH